LEEAGGEAVIYLNILLGYVIVGLANVWLCVWIHDEAVRLNQMQPDPDLEWIAWTAFWLWPLTLPFVLYSLAVHQPWRGK
jgi:hypothetical protein